MNDELEKLIDEKKQTDKKQRKASLIVMSLATGLILIIFYSITQKQKTNEKLIQTLDTTKLILTRKDSLVKTLNDTLKIVRLDLKKEIVECIGLPLGTNTADGLPKFNFILRIKDTSLIVELSSVGYYFDDVTYRPKLKISSNAKNNFSIAVNNSWGCMAIVPVYLHFKNNTTDTVLFPMCDKAKITLPKI